ncbi:Uncharacterised protein [Mycobacteroides abscessus subsp. abscessus]|nr:Uncharacterised protein [Mycobacteroides abscessus subsp. abscessus]SKM19132.1 Uncharacterised protein [Mycobacteroides abscessus subsp. massiliense]
MAVGTAIEHHLLGARAAAAPDPHLMLLFEDRPVDRLGERLADEADTDSNVVGPQTQVHVALWC